MTANSKIEWCEHTFNPWIGCAKVGPPCDHCYAESMSKRYGWATWGPHGERKRTSDANWKLPLRWAKQARASGSRPRVFCASLADWLDNQVPQSWREDLGYLIRATPELDWLLLTKRIQNYKKLAPWPLAPDNVWLGITCGDQLEYDRDWPKLRNIPATVRFISYEPALGPLRMGLSSLMEPDWIIAGGESGPAARPAHPKWFSDLRDDCNRLGIAFLFKQWGEWAPGFTMWTEDRLRKEEVTVLPDGRVREWQPDYPSARLTSLDMVSMRRVGKKSAGRLLDGREWNEVPGAKDVPA